MALKFEIQYHPLVIRDDIPKISSAWRDRIKTAIEDKLMTYPEVHGRPLRRSLRGYRKLRVGDYRVVFRITGSRIYIMAILHRSVVYDVVSDRV